MIMNVRLVLLGNGHERRVDLPAIPRVGETVALQGYDGDDPSGEPELVQLVSEVRHMLRSYLQIGEQSFYDETIVFLVNPPGSSRPSSERLAGPS